MYTKINKIYDMDKVFSPGIFTHGVSVVLLTFLGFLVICYLFARFNILMMSPKLGKQRVKFSLFISLFINVCYLLLFLFSYNVCKFKLTPFTFSSFLTIWEQQLSIIDQVTWSNVWWWYYELLAKLSLVFEFYMFWFASVVISINSNIIGLKRAIKDGI